MLSNGRNNDDRKIIVRQLDFNTTQTTIEHYFSQYGHVREIIMKFNETGRSKGFCFVVFNEKQAMEEVLKTTHQIDGKTVQVRRAGEAAGSNLTNKLFCGGLPHALSEDDLREYFSQYGQISNFEFIFEKGTQVRRHFCFILFEDPNAVEKITEGKLPPGSVVHHIGKYRVECKKKFEDNHPIQKKVKRESNMKKTQAESEGWEESWEESAHVEYAVPRATGYPIPRAAGYTAPTRRPLMRGRAAHAPSSYAAYPGYDTAYTDPYASYAEYTDPYATTADPYAAQDPYAEYSAGYTESERVAYPATSAVSGYSSYPGYESEYGATLPSGGGPMKARGGARGGGRGAYRPY